MPPRQCRAGIATLSSLPLSQRMVQTKVPWLQQESSVDGIAPTFYCLCERGELLLPTERQTRLCSSVIWIWPLAHV
jgi:hypothetical protein